MCTILKCNAIYTNTDVYVGCVLYTDCKAIFQNLYRHAYSAVLYDDDKFSKLVDIHTQKKEQQKSGYGNIVYSYKTYHIHAEYM